MDQDQKDFEALLEHIDSLDLKTAATLLEDVVDRMIDACPVQTDRYTLTVKTSQAVRRYRKYIDSVI